jgi:intracellular sulfur oxidation DsrE/DsrF family protein
MSKEKDVPGGLPPLNLNAPGIDVGNAEHTVAVPPGRGPQPVGAFGRFRAAVRRMGQRLVTSRGDKVLMQATGRSMRICAVIGYAIFLIAGIYGSLKVVTWLSKIHPDTTYSILLWYGVNAHGFAWLQDWRFTPDNMLLSTVPFNFLGFMIFGPKPAVFILFGWLTFILSAFISGAIAWQLKAKKAAIILSLALLFFGYYANDWGMVSGAHNITNLFGLAALYLILKWSQKPSVLKLIAVLAILIAGAVSDPWMLAGYNLPIALVGIAFLMFPRARINRANGFKLLLVSIVSIASVKTKLFGVLDFVPSLHFAPANWATINNNTIFLIKDLGGLLNIIPFEKSTDFLPAILTLVVILSLLIFSVFKAVKSGHQISSSNIAFICFATFSIGGMALAFVISDLEAMDYSGRYLLNCIYLIPIGLGVLVEHNWPRSSKIEKAICTSVPVLFVLSGIVSTFQMWRSPGFALKDMGAGALIKYLKMNGLSYGYGSYWGSQANAVTALSKGEVVIRPVVFNKRTGTMIAGTRAETNKRWYSERDFPPNQKQFFVFVTSDFEECADVNLCTSGVIRQFGDPVRTLKYESATILVWDHPLIGPKTPRPIVLGRAIKFNDQNPPLWQGWAAAEKWGTWSDADSALVVLALSSTPKNDLELVIDGGAFLAAKHPSQEVDVLVNGQHVDTLKYDLRSNGGVRVVKIPKALALENSGQLLIKFSIKNPESPAELGLSTDPRRLGFGIISLELRYHPPVAPKQKAMPVVLGKAIIFNSHNPPIWRGWSFGEKWGTWSDGDSALVLLALSSTPKNDLELLIDGHAFLAEKHPSEEVDIAVNGHAVDTLKYDLQSNGGVRVVKIPKAVALERNGQLLIQFNFNNPISPKELSSGSSADARRLGLGIVSLELREEN